MEPKPARYFISLYTDGPVTRWNVIDRNIQEWLIRFSRKADAEQYAELLNNHSRLEDL